jgi:hypothetical protein
MKNAIIWDVMPHGSCGVFLRSMRRLLVTANIVPSSLILVTLMMEALHSFNMLVLDSILHSHRCENLKSYILPDLIQLSLLCKMSLIQMSYV